MKKFAAIFQLAEKKKKKKNRDHIHKALYHIYHIVYDVISCGCAGYYLVHINWTGEHSIYTSLGNKVNK